MARSLIVRITSFNYELLSLDLLPAVITEMLFKPLRMHAELFATGRADKSLCCRLIVHLQEMFVFFLFIINKSNTFSIRPPEFLVIPFDLSDILFFRELSRFCFIRAETRLFHTAIRTIGVCLCTKPSKKRHVLFGLEIIIVVLNLYPSITFMTGTVAYDSFIIIYITHYTDPPSKHHGVRLLLLDHLSDSFLSHSIEYRLILQAC